jgi:hypothetical protein
MLVRMYNAAIRATRDRIIISQGARSRLSGADLEYYNILKSQSGPSVHKPKRIIKSWFKAYNHQMQQAKWINQIEKPFKRKNVVGKLLSSIFK